MSRHHASPGQAGFRRRPGPYRGPVRAMTRPRYGPAPEPDPGGRRQPIRATPDGRERLRMAAGGSVQERVARPARHHGLAFPGSAQQTARDGRRAERRRWQARSAPPLTSGAAPAARVGEPADWAQRRHDAHEAQTAQRNHDALSASLITELNIIRMLALTSNCLATNAKHNCHAEQQGCWPSGAAACLPEDVLSVHSVSSEVLQRQCD